MKKILLFVTALFVAASVSSCDKDNDKDVSIVGNWQLVRTFGWEIDQEYDSDDTEDQEFWTFNADGKTGFANWLCVDHGNDTMPFTYSVNGDVVIMVSEFEGDKKTANYDIVKLTSKELHLYIHKANNNFVEYYTYCFIRK